ncbi:MAG: hypothetical protein ABWY19_08030 [Marmoricola sp.]
MYHPMMTFAIMQSKQEDLARDLHHHQLRARSRKAAAARRPRVPRQRNRLSASTRPSVA